MDQPPERVGVHRSRPAECQQAKLPRVKPALDADHPQRRVHVLVGDVDDRLSSLGDVDAESCGDRPDRAARGVLVDLERSGELRARRDAVQHDVGVGHGRLLAAPTVRGGTRLGAGALGADAERPDRRQIGDRAAAGTDAVHVHTT